MTKSKFVTELSACLLCRDTVHDAIVHRFTSGKAVFASFQECAAAWQVLVVDKSLHARIAIRYFLHRATFNKAISYFLHRATFLKIIALETSTGLKNPCTYCSTLAEGDGTA